MNLIPKWLVKLATMLAGLTIVLYLPSQVFGLFVLFCAGIQLGTWLDWLGEYFHKKLNGLEDDYEDYQQEK